MEITSSEYKDRYPFSVFSEDEQNAISGLKYLNLPPEFKLSPFVLKSVDQVWDSFDNYEPIKESAAHDRATKYFADKAAQGDEEAIQWLNRRNSYWSEVKKDTEFGRQIYRLGNEIVVGNVHKGMKRSIDLRQELDGIPDDKSIVQIHNHPNDMTFSEKDLMGAFANIPKIPKHCIYIATGPTKISVMFPTIETPRPEVEMLYNQLKRDFDEKYHVTELPLDEQLSAQLRLITEIASNFRLAYFYGDRNGTLNKM